MIERNIVFCEVLFNIWTVQLGLFNLCLKHVLAIQFDYLIESFLQFSFEVDVHVTVENELQERTNVDSNFRISNEKVIIFNDKLDERLTNFLYYLCENGTEQKLRVGKSNFFKNLFDESLLFFQFGENGLHYEF